MSKYTKYQILPPDKKGLNPIWRGIGCILIIVVPLLGYLLMTVTVPPILSTGLVPTQLLENIRFPNWVIQSQILGHTAGLITSLNHPWVNIIVFFVMVLLLTGVSSLLYTVVYSIIGPPVYKETDAPPSEHKPGKYTR